MLAFVVAFLLAFVHQFVGRHKSGCRADFQLILMSEETMAIIKHTVRYIKRWYSCCFVIRKTAGPRENDRQQANPQAQPCHHEQAVHHPIVLDDGEFQSALHRIA